MNTDQKRQISEELARAKKAYMTALRIAENAGAKKDFIRKIEVLTGRTEALEHNRMLQA